MELHFDTILYSKVGNGKSDPANVKW